MKRAEIDTDWLASIVGTGLLAVRALYYTVDGVVDNEPQELEFVFGGGAVKILGLIDGESLGVECAELQEKNLGEYGSLNVFDASAESRFRDLVGRRLQRISLLMTKGVDVVRGVVFEFQSKIQISLLNLGDELFVFERVSEGLMEEERLYSQIVACAKNEKGDGLI